MLSKDILSKLETYAATLAIGQMAYADLREHEVYLHAEHTDFLLQNGYHWGISLALPLAQSVCDLLQFHNEQGPLFYFHSHCIWQADRLDCAAQQIASFINAAGYKAIAIPGRKSAYNEGMPGIIAHRTVARLSGLGSIGDSGMILHPEYGPRIRLASIITSLPLNEGNRITPDFCLHCGKCREACPSNSISGKHFAADNPSVTITNSLACSAYRTPRLEQLGTKFCNLCQWACPVGKKNLT